MKEEDSHFMFISGIHTQHIKMYYIISSIVRHYAILFIGSWFLKGNKIS